MAETTSNLQLHLWLWTSLIQTQMLADSGLCCAIFHLMIVSSFDFWGGERKGWVGDQRHQLHPHPHVKSKLTCFRMLKKTEEKQKKYKKKGRRNNVCTERGKRGGLKFIFHWKFDCANVNFTEKHTFFFFSFGFGIYTSCHTTVQKGTGRSVLPSPSCTMLAASEWIVSVIHFQWAKSRHKMEEDHKMLLEEVKFHQHFLQGDQAKEWVEFWCSPLIHV